MTGLLEPSLYRTDEVEGASGEHRTGEPEREGDVELFLAEEQLHPSLDEIFRQIDAAHRRTLESERMRPAHARHGSR